MSWLPCMNGEESSGDEVEDDDAENLSHIGKAAYEVLRKKHNHQWNSSWNVTGGRCVGKVRQTPAQGPDCDQIWADPKDPPVTEPVGPNGEGGHDFQLPRLMGEIMSRTKVWCDVTSLGPPDGEFLVQFKKALVNIAATGNKQGGAPIIVRLLFGNIVGMPVNCDQVISDLTADLSEDDNIQIWVGAWRKGVSWNHSKIIAVDGRFLHNGGHNLWDLHYLRGNPVHDLSMEAEGHVALDGHNFANTMWAFIQKEQTGIIGAIVAHLPDNLPMVLQTRVTVSEFPEGTPEFPPQYEKKMVPKYERVEGHIPMITMGRFGVLLKNDRPSDDAILSMLQAATTSIRCSLQDLGPICLPGLDRATVPGCVWPKAYLTEMGIAIYERGVDIEIALSTPGSIPAGLKPTDALYGNGWTCADVASELIKTVHETYEDVDPIELRKMVNDNLRVTYIKHNQNNKWANGLTLGNHCKHFIIDDTAYYIGSQNLYICDLAEWGILVDDKEQCAKCMNEYWNPMWKASYTPKDCDVEEVIAGIEKNREGPPVWNMTKKQLALAQNQCSNGAGSAASLAHHAFNPDETAH